jgi:hypothetical protein
MGFSKVDAIAKQTKKIAAKMVEHETKNKKQVRK